MFSACFFRRFAPEPAHRILKSNPKRYMPEPKQMRGLLIMANYNQAVEIGQVLDRVIACQGTQDVVVVDDGSTDGSAEIAKRKGFLVLSHERNMGIGAAIRTGIQYAIASGQFDFVTISSTNGKIQPEQVAANQAPIIAGDCEYVQGSRNLNAGSSPDLTPFRRLAIPIFTSICNQFLGQKFTDITCGFRSYTLDFIKDPRLDLNQDWLNRYELEYYVHYWACKTGVRIKEVPVTIVYSHLQKNRKSKIVPVIGWWSMFRPFVLLSLGLRH